MKTETVLQKVTIADMLKLGISPDTHVMMDVCGDLEDVASGETNAKLSQKPKAIRTTKQRKSIELFCKLLAFALNAAGWTKKKYFEAKTHDDVDWTQAGVKEDIWRHIQTALYPERKSTTQLETNEVSAVYENINRMTSDNLGVGLDFPNRFHGIKYED